MKINKEDEYGLRILIRIAKVSRDNGLSIPQLSEMEGMSQSYVGKITRALRLGNLIVSTRGKKGGYVLAKSAHLINIKEVIDVLGGQLFSREYCNSHSGVASLCTNSVDCSVRSLWKVLQYTVDRVFENVTVADLIGNEDKSTGKLDELTQNLFLETMV